MNKSTVVKVVLTAVVGLFALVIGAFAIVAIIAFIGLLMPILAIVAAFVLAILGYIYAHMSSNSQRQYRKLVGGILHRIVRKIFVR